MLGRLVAETRAVGVHLRLYHPEPDYVRLFNYVLHLLVIHRWYRREGFASPNAQQKNSLCSYLETQLHRVRSILLVLIILKRDLEELRPLCSPLQSLDVSPAFDSHYY